MTDEREELIRRIGDLQRDLARTLAHDRSLPLLASTLTMQQLKTIVLLSSLGSASGQELARYLGVGLATVTGIVDRLVAHGLVTRREDPADRRVRRVELTEAGRALTDKLTTAGTDGLMRILRQLDLDTLRTLADVLPRVVKVAEEVMREEDTLSPKMG